MSQTYVLEALSLCKKFKAFKAVDSVSFGLKKGEILGLLGPNGAGKTTTIQMLLGILNPTSGYVKYFGKELNGNKEEILEKVNFSSTYINLPWRLKISEILKYNSYLYQINNRKERINKIVTMFKLETLLNKQVLSLSSGQVTRLNLAKAFLNFPQVLLLDEPTASLDPETADYIRHFILNQRKKYGVSILFTSHNMTEIEKICDRVIFIKNGKIIAEDTPKNLPKTIKNCKLELVMIDGLKRTIELCSKSNLSYNVYKRAIEIEIKEKEIINLLNKLAKKKIEYDQISIKKPDLEDYFLKIVKEK